MRFLKTKIFPAMVMLCMATACSSPKRDTKVEQNIEMFTHVWDEIMNKRNLNMFNESNYTKNIILHARPPVAGIDRAKEFYANYLDGFSDIEFTMKETIGMNETVVVYWDFKGTHTGAFFGIPATGRKVDIEGVTLIRMENGKIAEERDFLDNLEFMQQLGIIPK
jgi:steroid delta-isomerase-like uncharacterized protein